LGWQLIAAVLVASIVLASGAVWTNALGAGDRFEGIVDRVERFIAGPVPDRPTLETVSVTPRPARPSPTPRPSGSTDPRVRPSPTPVRGPVDFNIVADAEAAFASQVDADWCAVAGTQMILAYHGRVDTSDGVQREIASRIREWESWKDSHNGNWGPAAIAKALEAYGAPGYEIRAYESRADALFDSAVTIKETNAPAILIAWRGAHTWVMTGYRADADPTLFPDATISGAYILDPWFPRISKIWGPSNPPGTFTTDAELTENILPWKRPEGLYPDRDGKFIVVAPTIPVTAAG
jgi:hypothetical protein